jgi:hypothetical protein
MFGILYKRQCALLTKKMKFVIFLVFLFAETFLFKETKFT